MAGGHDASSLVRESQPLIGGRGGGKPTFAQAGGDNPDGVPAALEAAKKALE